MQLPRVLYPSFLLDISNIDQSQASIKPDVDLSEYNVRVNDRTKPRSDMEINTIRLSFCSKISQPNEETENTQETTE